jgi:hypothetical protein
MENSKEDLPVKEEDEIQRKLRTAKATKADNAEVPVIGCTQV